VTVTAPADDELPRGIARFRGADGRVTGCGFLIEQRTLCTCAHVVAGALGTDEADPAPPTADVTVEFPLLTPPSARLRATVTHWRPVTGDGGGDIALLTLAEPVPGTAPVRFAGGTAVWDHRFRVLGFPLRTDDHGVWVHGRLRAPVGKGWTSMEAGEMPHGPAIGQGFSGAPVWDTEQGGVVGMTVAADTGSGARTAYLIPAALLLGLEPGLCPSPFRGLEPFREEDAAVFFARHADSERIAEAVRTHAFVPVAGASGVGKSSLVRAGVLPRLRADGLTVTDFAGQPDTAPVRTLAEALAAHFPATRHLVGDLCAADADTVRRTETAVLLGARLLDGAGPRGHVILLDQFEETVGARPADARALLDVLLPMTRAVHPAGRRLHVLATLRSASLEELVAGGRAEDLSGTVQMVAPMTPAQLDEVVRRPVDTIPGVEFEPGLAELIVADGGGEPGALPLVEFALAELWERQAHGRLTHAAYREIGGVEGALSRYADHQLAQVCKAPGGPAETVARRLFERLARPVKGKEYARVARAFDQLPDELRTAAQALAATRLLVIARDSSGRETVALAHEALVRQWPTLRGWLDESRDFLTWLEKLRGRLRDWEESGRHPDLLLREQELTAARTWAAQRPGEMSAGEEEFVRLSRLHRRRLVRRGRTGVALVACLAVLAAGLSFGLYSLWDEKGENNRKAAAETLAAFAGDRTQTHPVDAALLALSARHTSDIPQVRTTMAEQGFPLSSLRSAHRILPAGTVREVAASVDGHRMVVRHEGTGLDQEVFVVADPFGEEPTAVPLPDPPLLADMVAVSDDGRRAAAASGDGTVRIWDVTRPRAPRSITPPRWKWQAQPAAGTTLALDFSPDGTRLVHAVARDSLDTPCEGDDLGKWMRVVRVTAAGVEEEKGTEPPGGLLKPDECLRQAALRSRGSEVTVTAEDGETSDQTARTSGGKTVGQGSWVVLGTGGRSLGTDDGSGSHWRTQPSMSNRTNAKGLWPTSYDFHTDCSGRYVMKDTRYDDRSPRRETVTESGPVLLQDLLTGRRHYLVLPRAVPADALCVVEGKGKEVLALSALGQDFLTFRARQSPTSLGAYELEPLNDFDYAAAPAVAAQLRQDDDAPYELHAFVTDADGTRHGRVSLKSSDQFTERVVLSQDGGMLLVWRKDAWELLGTDKVDRLRGDESTPGRRLAIRDVQRYGNRDFLVLEESGLSVLHGEDGTVTRVPEVGCAQGPALNRRACATVISHPRGRHEVLVLRAGGRAELWRLGPGRPREADHADFSPPAEDVAVPAVFRSDGSAVAVSTTRGVELWKPGHREPYQLTGDAELAGPYDRSGRLVIRSSGSAEGRAELWDEDGRSGRLLTLNSRPRLWDFQGDRLRGLTPVGFLDYDLGPLHDGSPAHLCRLLGPRPPDLWRSPPDSITVPPEADRRPPCPDRR
jgi:hypothetical protein